MQLGTTFAIFHTTKGFAYIDLGTIRFGEMPKKSGARLTLEQAIVLRKKFIDGNLTKAQEIRNEKFNPSLWRDDKYWNDTACIREANAALLEEATVDLKIVRIDMCLMLDV